MSVVIPVEKKQPECNAKWMFRFQSLRYSVPLPDGQMFEILKGCSGGLRFGEMCAIIGASGAGKTTLLNLLSGRAWGGTTGKGSKILLNDKPIVWSTFKHLASYVTQDDILLCSLTPKEVLEFAARIRGFSSTDDGTSISHNVNEIIQKLGLEECQNTTIGEPGLRHGISGGQRKRVNIGQSLVTDPKLLFLDEPTSGLDSHTALSVMQMVKNIISAKQKSALVTIHQPNEDIVKLFDSVILMAKGEIAYFGPSANVRPFLSKAGFPCPIDVNIADHAVSLLQADDSCTTLLDFGRKLTDEQNKVDPFPKDVPDINDASLDKDANIPSLSHHTASYCTQFYLLCRRSFAIQVRTPMLTKVRLAQTVGPSVLMGVVYWQVGLGQNTVQDRMGALFMSCVMNMMLSALGVLHTFPAERAVFVREYSDGAYGSALYYLSKVAVDTPFQCLFGVIHVLIFFNMVGLAGGFETFLLYTLTIVLLVNVGASFGFLISGATGDVELSLSIMPGIFMPLMLFTGFLVNLDNVTWALRWIKYVNPITYAYSIVAIGEFKELQFTCSEAQKIARGGLCPTNTGQEVIDMLGVEAEFNRTQSFLILCLLIIFLRFAGMVALQLSLKKQLQTK
eukprot:g3465.t1